MPESKEFPSDKADKFVVRFPDGMRDRIRKDADEQGRSMNAQIIHILQAHYDAIKSKDTASAPEYVDFPNDTPIDIPANEANKRAIMKAVEDILASENFFHSLSAAVEKLRKEDPSSVKIYKTNDTSKKTPT